MNIQAKLNQANGRLRAGKVGVRIEARGEHLYLRATFPPKPGSKKQQPCQQRLALGLHANPSGVSAAEAQARKIGALLDCKEFSWNPYLENFELRHTIGSWSERFERQHGAEVIQNQASLTTWKTDYFQVFKNLPPGEPLTLAALINYITSTNPDSRTRKRAGITTPLLPRVFRRTQLNRIRIGFTATNTIDSDFPIMNNHAPGHIVSQVVRQTNVGLLK